jgi:hypothetical protein
MVERQLEKTGGSVSTTHMRADIPDQLAGEESEVEEDAPPTEEEASE